MRRLDRDLEVPVVEPLEELDLLERGGDERLRLVLLREVVEVLGERAGLAPMRIGMPARFAAFTTCSTLSGPPMFPGLIRTAATPASIALSASEALKWMSAMTGSGDSLTIVESAAASSFFGTATRTISHPADASAAICAVVPATSCVFVSVIDCTATGAPPPTGTLPTRIWTSLGTARA